MSLFMENQATGIRIIRLWFVYSIHYVNLKIYTYVRFLMNNLIRSKEDQIRKQEAEIAKKTHEIVLLEQSFSQTPIDSTSDSLYKVSFAGRQYTRKFNS